MTGPYRRLTDYSTSGEESIKGRLAFLEKLFFAAWPDIEPIVAIPTFTDEQRLAIFPRGSGACQRKTTVAVNASCGETDMRITSYHIPGMTKRPSPTARSLVPHAIWQKASGLVLDEPFLFGCRRVNNTGIRHRVQTMH